MVLHEVRDFGRSQLASMTYLLGFKTGVEIGVAEGAYSALILDANPDMHLTGVDPWVSYEGYRDYVRKSTFDRLETRTRNRLEKHPRYTILKEFSMDALPRFKDGSLDFVYLDGNHEDPFVTQDIEGWYPKLRKGGILAGHDYVRTKLRNGPALSHNVKEAVNRFCENNNLELYILGNEAINEGLVRDRPRSWFIWKK